MGFVHSQMVTTVYFYHFQDYKNFWKREQLKIEKELLKEERMRIKLKTGNLKDFKVEPIKHGGLKEKYLKYKKRAR